ncbi:hypothetical protein CERZMDRAFT_87300 [Cercospora zeae-maydis SCOH1-5]|uniref:Uncharacterized protein n=1 Tax=Cercospora zeae-maydis SCOH1-5 TaxID=717836 RepID=A0A6A6F348_9PEZI|nr:hypothetical protein CERZMDRAFT_87300 [Cercospora zeae-maydis SCOH1-5]
MSHRASSNGKPWPSHRMPMTLFTQAAASEPMHSGVLSSEMRSISLDRRHEELVPPTNHPIHCSANGSVHLSTSTEAATITDPNFPSFRRTFFIATHYQSFFKTVHGYIGLADAPPVQDEIWLLVGGSVPFLLRPYAGDSEYAGCHSLVGDCYIHGMMDGEMVGRDKGGEGDRGWEEVVLA